ncbi:hypothetical protein HNP10_000357 [Aeromonas veronii]|jgi:hypothetical protein|uniref:hypothetical protein n=1 Tax=Aeromonas TaxID=642 RepID=UPI00161DD95A|nr:hypothetical protein [Aeromonas veronii]MCS3831642.1 hypothetical protein [Aeromonas veronii]
MAIDTFQNGNIVSADVRLRQLEGQVARQKSTVSGVKINAIKSAPGNPGALACGKTLPP